MSKVRAIIVGGIIWILGSSFYAASYLFPLLNDPELQADLVLAVAIIPNAWLGAHIFYRKSNLSGPKLGAIVVLTAIILDALITVPYLIVPQGGTYYSFFSAPAFWLIAFEYLMVVVLYWHFRVKSSLAKSK
ncbi:hypothetical protein SAMN06265379_10123 [Saccharicrinis carchari]|uniref:Uncharacterized protein n=1 Tax=Saccharicrinis carchari TaxID=1168039 RepID=A0A521AC72_SACCC|nr:DUF5367 family protein [Saccharicrinis carchari]SMO32427.1 hypothetical protein SAMN06265379_10123 [Saccharicrinis carchari]